MKKSFSPMFRILLFALLAVTIISSFSNAAIAEEKTRNELFAKWLVDLRQQAIEEGIKENIFDTAMHSIKLNETVVRLDGKQPERTISFKEYEQRVVPTSRIRKGKRMFEKHEVLLKEIGQKYRVQPRFIVALWGIETDFGANMGGFYIPEALASLAFDGRRGEFFTKELLSSLKIIQDGHITTKKMIGSWAGAMGQSQFMPSSFLKYAVDYNGDGKKDIWNNEADIFASMANYLAQEGWNVNLTWGREVNLPEEFDIALADMKIEKSLKEWQNLGIRRTDGRDLPARDLKASIVLPGGIESDAFLVYANYKTILHWNRSKYFATSVGLLSDAIGAK